MVRHLVLTRSMRSNQIATLEIPEELVTRVTIAQGQLECKNEEMEKRGLEEETENPHNFCQESPPLNQNSQSVRKLAAKIDY